MKGNNESKFKVLAWALLGYAYIILIISTIILLIGLLITAAINRTGSIYSLGKLTLPLIYLIYIIIKSLWIKIEEPVGRELHRHESEKLFNIINEIRIKLKSPKIHKILITHEFNASIAQIPKLGIFGFHKNYLTIGFPLMMALTEEEFKGVVAHELGHLRGKHGRFSVWIYRVRESWFRIMESLEAQEHWGSFIFRRFFKWYVPRFALNSFQYIRENEYEADRCGEEIVGSKIMAQSITATNVKGDLLDGKFWVSLDEVVKNESKPPEDIYTRMKDFFKKDMMDEGFVERSIKKMMEREAREDDTHPVPRLRFQNLGAGPELNLYITMSSDDELLGESLQNILNEFNCEWKNSILEYWNEKHLHIQEIFKKEKEFGSKKDLSENEQIEYALAINELHGDDASIELYRKVLNINTDNAEANFQLGRILTSKNNYEGIEMLERAMDTDIGYTVSACEFIYYYYLNLKMEEEAEKYYEKAKKHEEAIEAAKTERDVLKFDSTYIEHDLNEEEIEYIKEQLIYDERIKELYLAQKEVQYFKDSPLYVLGIVFKMPWYWHIFDNNYVKLVDELADKFEFEKETILVALNGQDRKFRKIMKKISESKIY